MGIPQSMNLRYRNKGRRTHGLSDTPEHNVWSLMKRRCLDPDCYNFKDYGGRGIKVCDRWANSFEAFIADLGMRPSPGHTIERIDNDGNYEPGNVIWAPRSVQSANRRNCVRVEIDGVRRSLNGWLAAFSISKTAYYDRVRKGMTPEQALSIPVDPIKSKNSRGRR